MDIHCITRRGKKRQAKNPCNCGIHWEKQRLFSRNGTAAEKPKMMGSSPQTSISYLYYCLLRSTQIHWVHSGKLQSPAGIVAIGGCCLDPVHLGGKLEHQTLIGGYFCRSNQVMHCEEEQTPRTSPLCARCVSINLLPSNLLLPRLSPDLMPGNVQAQK